MGAVGLEPVQRGVVPGVLVERLCRLVVVRLLVGDARRAADDRPEAFDRSLRDHAEDEALSVRAMLLERVEQCGIGQPIGVISFLMMPSACATA